MAEELKLDSNWKLICNGNRNGQNGIINKRGYFDLTFRSNLVNDYKSCDFILVIPVKEDKTLHIDCRKIFMPNSVRLMSNPFDFNDSSGFTLNGEYSAYPALKISQDGENVTFDLIGNGEYKLNFKVLPEPPVQPPTPAPRPPTQPPTAAPRPPVQPVPAKPAPKPPVQPAKPAPKPPVQPAKPAPKPPVQPAKPAPKPPVQPAKPAPKPLVQPAKPAPKPPVQPAKPAPKPPVQPAKPAPKPPTQPAKPAPKPPTQPAKPPIRSIPIKPNPNNTIQKKSENVGYNFELDDDMMSTISSVGSDDVILGCAKAAFIKPGKIRLSICLSEGLEAITKETVSVNKLIIHTSDDEIVIVKANVLTNESNFETGAVSIMSDKISDDILSKFKGKVLSVSCKLQDGLKIDKTPVHVPTGSLSTKSVNFSTKSNVNTIPSNSSNSNHNISMNKNDSMTLAIIFAVLILLFIYALINYYL